ncbi:MAG: NAD(P)H-dependent glycerol-3-phosphate dehydrogenase [Granulosicoccus sp.]
MTELHRLTVIGAGSWGTALAIQFARAGSAVTLWGRNPEQLEQLVVSRVNERYLPGAAFPDTLHAVTNWDEAVKGAETILVSVPSHAFRGVLETLAKQPGLSSDTLSLCWATKGLEMSTGLLPHQVVRDVLPECSRVAVLSGPTFATEVGIGLPTAITVAATDETYATELAERISSPGFRAYTSTDIVGVEIGGAVKNVLAIAAGLSDGLGFGANARIALINRGLREMMRLGEVMGAKPETFSGLACMGDLVLTCTDNQSRNRRTGLALAEGRSISDIEADMGQVVEGVSAARAVHEQALRLHADMPIVEQVYRIVHEGISARDAVSALMARATGAELD